MGPVSESDAARPLAATARPWWERADLRAAKGRLRIAGGDALEERP